MQCVIKSKSRYCADKFEKLCRQIDRLKINPFFTYLFMVLSCTVLILNQDPKQ